MLLLLWFVGLLAIMYGAPQLAFFVLRARQWGSDRSWEEYRPTLGYDRRNKRWVTGRSLTQSSIDLFRAGPYPQSSRRRTIDTLIAIAFTLMLAYLYVRHANPDRWVG